MASPKWTPISRLDVLYQDDGNAQSVGGLAIDSDGVAHFQYSAEWLEKKLELSPLSLPLSLGLEVTRAPDPRRLNGLHGLFSDSLPDSWGQKVLNQALRRHGIDPRRAGALDKLGFLGARTMGALTYRPQSDAEEQTTDRTTIEDLAAQAEQVEGGTLVDDGRSAPAPNIDALERAAGSPGGAQPKALISVSPDGQVVVTGGEPPEDYRSYLLKFTPRRAGMGLRADQGVIEDAYARMARASGLHFPETTLFRTSDGREHFAVERFDRTKSNGRRHVHTLGGLLGREASDDGDYDELLRWTRALTEDVRPLEEVLRRLCFNLAALNDDDHLKNVAFLLDPTLGWQLAPAYDLTFSPNPSGGRGMSVDGLDEAVSWGAVSTLAEKHGITKKRTREIREQVEDTVSRWRQFAKDAGVVDASAAELEVEFETRRRSLRK